MKNKPIKKTFLDGIKEELGMELEDFINQLESTQETLIEVFGVECEEPQIRSFKSTYWYLNEFKKIAVKIEKENKL